VIRHTELVRGSTRGWTMGLSNKKNRLEYYIISSQSMLETYILTGLSLWPAGICLTVTFNQICWSFPGSSCVSSNFSFFLSS